MTESISKELEEIEHLTIVGKYQEAINRIEEILKTEKISESEKIRVLILKSKSLARLGLFEVEDDNYEKSCELSSLAFNLSKEIDDLVSMVEAKVWYLSVYRLKMDFNPNEFLKEVKQLEDIYEEIKRKKISLPKEIEASILLVLYQQNRAQILINEDFIWDHKESFELLDKGLNLIQEIEKKEVLMLFQWANAETYKDINDYDKALQFYEEALGIAKEIGNEHFKSFFLYEIGGTYWLKGEFDLLFEYQMKALEIREKQENERGVGLIYNRLGIYYWETGDWKKGLEYFQKAHEIISENGKRERYYVYLNNIGTSHVFLGNLDEALKCFELAYKNNKKLGLLEYAYLNLNNISNIYSRRGEFDKALELNEEILAYREKTADKRGIANVIYEMGFIYRKKGMFNKALECFKEHLKYMQELGVKSEIAGILYHLISLTSEFNRNDLAEKYHEKLEKITEEIEYKPYRRLALLSEAVILKNSKISRDRVRAEVLLDQLLLEDFSQFFHIEVLFQLCYLLLSELKATSEEKILSKLQKYVSKLIEIGTSSKLPYLIVESLWFKSQLSLLNLNFEKARALLNQALSTAEDKGFNFLALKMTKSKEELIKQTIEMEELAKEVPTISKRMDVIEIENGFKGIRSSGMFQFKQNI
ncbi:MAG: tetratricopeptide repeat protein [Candidatus Heimdallarchaeota archaeon]|nr:tetratricopeptide repeat protein [Candidatus Heimdallarchaeota archaeon]